MPSENRRQSLSKPLSQPPGQVRITADTAMRFGRYFGTSPEFWINLQARYDLDVANRTLWAQNRAGGRAQKRSLIAVVDF
jgi:plasmid maintenance system antidote protein VapI